MNYYTVSPKAGLVFLGLLASLSFGSCADERQQEETAQKNLKEEKTSAQTDPISSENVSATSVEYQHELVVPDLQIGWGIAVLPDGSILVTEKSGELIQFKEGEKSVITGTPEIYNRGQGGFLDIAVHPDYEKNGWLYFTFASSTGEGEGGNTALMRAQLKNGELVQKELLYKAEPNSTRGQHFGSRIEFDQNGLLYFSIGDRGNRDQNPQDISRDGGKIYRLNDDGSVPAGNPFAGQQNAKEAVFSYGHRNPQGMIFNPETNEIWIHEHGPQGGDEINVVQEGKNYGWPTVTYGINYDGTPITEETTGPDYENPIFYWIPSIAPSGFAFITSDKYPELKGDLLVGSLKFQYLEHLELEGKKVTGRNKLLEGIGRIRDVIQTPEGDILVSVEGTGVVRLIPPSE